MAGNSCAPNLNDFIGRKVARLREMISSAERASPVVARFAAYPEATPARRSLIRSSLNLAKPQFPLREQPATSAVISFMRSYLTKKLLLNRLRHNMDRGALPAGRKPAGGKIEHVCPLQFQTAFRCVGEGRHSAGQLAAGGLAERFEPGLRKRRMPEKAPPKPTSAIVEGSGTGVANISSCMMLSREICQLAPSMEL
jgi:hypothetical protein